jgi:hypothetical protein
MDGEAMRTAAAVGSAVISLIALGISTIGTTSSLRQRRRQEDAAVTGDLYPVLRSVRDSAWQYWKPLGGQQNDDLIALHNALLDLADLHPAVRDGELRQQVVRILGNDAAGMALSIDPRRFMGAFFGQEIYSQLDDLIKLADAAIQRCQALRRGAT